MRMTVGIVASDLNNQQQVEISTAQIRQVVMKGGKNRTDAYDGRNRRL